MWLKHPKCVYCCTAAIACPLSVPATNVLPKIVHVIRKTIKFARFVENHRTIYSSTSLNCFYRNSNKLKFSPIVCAQDFNPPIVGIVLICLVSFPRSSFHTWCFIALCDRWNLTFTECLKDLPSNLSVVDRPSTKLIWKHPTNSFDIYKIENDLLKLAIVGSF